MGYINFKEEKVVALEELKKRKENNYKIFKDMKKDRNLDKNFKSDDKFSYKNFNKEFFGTKDKKSEDEFLLIENKDILCGSFIECDFSNIRFKNCKFIGCNFEKCNFKGGGVEFNNCIFVKSDTNKVPSLNISDNFSCSFNECKIYARFLACNLTYSIFEKCVLSTTSFEESDLSNSICIMCKWEKIIIRDSNLSGIKVVDTYIEDLEFRDILKSKLDEKSFFDKIEVRKKTRDEYEGLYMVYETLANKFKENQLNNNFGEYYYLCNMEKRKTLKLLPKIESYLYWVTCGYGERPEFTLIAALIVVLFFSLIYLFTGIIVDGEVVEYTINEIPNITLRHLNEATNLSFGIFGGVGWNASDLTGGSYIAENFEIIIGLILTGVGIGTLTRKIVR
ncbi:MAG: pentapeptide repeat-containing protein [Clostridium sp.]